MKLEEMDQAQLIGYIKELREENRTRREVVEEYEEAFGSFDEAQQRGLMHMIRTLGEDPSQGSILFRELADSIDGTEPTTTKEDEVSDEETKEEEMPLAEQIAQAVEAALEARETKFAEQRTQEEQEELQRQIEYWDNEAKKLGYEPNTPEAADLFFFANKLETTDLEAAHKELQKFNEFKGNHDTTEEPAAEGDESPEFPKTAGQSTGAPTTDPDFDYSDKAAVKDAVYALLDSDQEGV